VRLGVVVAILFLLLVAVPAAGAQAPAPAPDEPLPRDAGALAARLTAVTDATNAAADAWLASGAGGPPPEDVALGALYQQRVYRSLARRPLLTAAVSRALPRRLRPALRDSAGALRALFRLGGPPPARPPRFKLGDALPPDELRYYYGQAERRFGIPWNVLAAVNLVETNFNRIRSDSVAGARGPMQFVPSTWRRYGLGGDIRDPLDAILGAANYLRASGGRSNLRRALYAYNHSSLYVDAVLRYARRIAAGERGLVAMWSWQVFVRTPQGDRRLTGPGLP
jgi:soluble lytic murein transglycosylase-like protein